MLANPFCLMGWGRDLLPGAHHMAPQGVPDFLAQLAGGRISAAGQLDFPSIEHVVNPVLQH